MFFREYCGLLASIFSSFQASTLSRSPRLGFHMLYFKDDLISLELPGAFRQVSFVIAYISSGHSPARLIARFLFA